MRISNIRLIQFKRFDDLTINLGASPSKIVALIGPNGCGKSSVFDAFEQKLRGFRNKIVLDADYFSKAKYSTDKVTNAIVYNEGSAVTITPPLTSKKDAYIRSSYRYTAQLNVTEVKAQPAIEDAMDFPDSTIFLDDRLTGNYKRLLATSYSDFEKGNINGDAARKKLIDKINEHLKEVLDIRISSLGNVLESKGQLWFEKGTSKDFPYSNLSAGEKEILDLIIDLVIKVEHHNDTIFCIDEPELHLNTAVQRKLLNVINKLIPDACQLWIATHSIGFMRALQLDLKDDTQILDFSKDDYFTGTKTIHPLIPNQREWRRIFSIALDDLSDLISPKSIIYCEGRKEPSAAKDEQGVDAEVYNTVFNETHSDVLFVSSGGADEPRSNSVIALQILNKAFKGVQLLVLKDRDIMTDEVRGKQLTSDKTLRILRRHEMENYLLNTEVLAAFCAARSVTLDESEYKKICPDVISADLKPSIEAIKKLLVYKGSTPKFLKELAYFLKPGMTPYDELQEDIWPR